MDVKQEHARILREAVAHVANHGTPQLRMRMANVLGHYAMAVQPYCKHVDQVRMPGGEKACLDCGHRQMLELIRE